MLEIKKCAPESLLTERVHILKGEFRSGSQIHFPMESHICICFPKEDGMDVYTSTQWLDATQAAVAACLGIGNNQ